MPIQTFKINSFNSLLLVWMALLCINPAGHAQSVPSIEEDIPFLVTFGKDSETSWGDNNFRQVFFALVPKEQKSKFFIRVYDPNIGGKYDENKGAFNTKTHFMVYGGPKAWSSIGAEGVGLSRDIKGGLLLASKTFEDEPCYDGKWYNFGPFNPIEGEYVEKFEGYMFKVIAEGGDGDDGNLYRYFLSSSGSTNQVVEGGNMFTYEYTFRLPDDVKRICQIYPYIDDKTISIKLSNFDWDDDGEIKLTSAAKNGVLAHVSDEDNWEYNEFEIVDEEKNGSIQIQFIKKQAFLVKHNNVTIIIQNQYGVSLPFYVLPIGGVPVYKPRIKMLPVN